MPEHIKVFLSYAHGHDEDIFTRDLANQLRHRGHDVWLDEEQIQASQQDKEAVRKGILWSDHAILVISEAWLKRDWTQYELEIFKKEKSSSRLVPILRFQKGRHDLGPYLTGTTPIEWVKNTQSPDACYWQILCGLEAIPPGPRAEWEEKGRAAKEGPIRIPHSSSPIEVQAKLLGRYQTGDYRPLRCDRTKQWSLLDDLVTQDGHHAIFLPGCRGEGHQYFMFRVEIGLRDTPRRRMVPISWKRTAGPPPIKQDYLAALAQSLHCNSKDLVSALEQELNEHNLILLHPCVRDNVDDPSLLRYYTEWLPELLQEVQSSHVVKTIQPIEWPRYSWFSRAAATLVHPVQPTSIWVNQAIMKKRAHIMLKQVEQVSIKGYRVYVLPDLASIQYDHIIEFCKILGMPESERDGFAKRVMAGSETSEQILQGLADYLPDEESEEGGVG